jgi:hypothetical protein
VYYLRLVALTLIGFCLPIVAAVGVGPYMFQHTGNHPADEPAVRSKEQGGDRRARLQNPDVDQDGVPDTEGTETERLNQQPERSSAFYSVVTPDPALDPASDRYFVLSFQLRLTNSPKAGKRQKLFAKYVNKQSPFPGWAFALRRTDTSLRPEIFWQDLSGKGGWYTFEHIDLRRNHWYAFTLIARNQDLLSLYMEPLSAAEPSGSTEGEEEQSSDKLPESPGVHFLGGYSVAEIALAPTDAVMQFAPRFLETGEMRGELKGILLARPERLPRNPNRLKDFIAGGSDALHTKFDEQDVELSIDQDQRDQSRFHHEIRQQD